MAIVCPTCGHNNPAGTLICAKCFTLLVEIAHKGTGTAIISPEEAHPDSVWRVLRGPHANAPSKDIIAFYFKDVEKPLLIDVEQQVVFGRYFPQNNAQPRIDLEPYGASEKGVSRQHMLLRRTSNGLTVEDMASSNGTWLNGIRLRPYTASPLMPGDRLRLGSLEIEVQFGATANW